MPGCFAAAALPSADHKLAAVVGVTGTSKPCDTRATMPVLPSFKSSDTGKLQKLVHWYQKVYKTNVPTIYPNISKISKINTKYKIQSGRRPSPARRPLCILYFVVILDILNISGYTFGYISMYIFICLVYFFAT